MATTPDAHNQCRLDSHELLRLVLDTIPTRVFWKDRSSVFLGCNKMFAQDAGAESPVQIIGKTDFDFSWREQAELYRQDDRLVIESGQAKLHYEEPQTSRGRHVWVRTSKIPWRGPDGTILGVLGVYEDITERKRAKERLREQAGLLDIAHDAITVLDLEGRVQYWNHAAEKLYGWPVEEALGHSAHRLFFEEVPPEFIQALECILKHGEWSGELREIDRERKPVLVQTRATLVRDAAGRPKSMLFVSTDVTDKKALESKFLRVQRLETIGALASGIAHDLNNVLAPVSMAVDVLRLRAHDEQEQMLLQILATSAQRGAGIVRQLLTFSRGVEATRVLLRPKNLIKEVSKIIQETFPKSIQFRVDMEDDVWEIVGDPTQLHQVLLNLCVNARDAMPEGGMLTLAARNLRLDATQVAAHPEAKPGPYALLEVSDTGTGMSPEVLAKIFTPFFTTKPVGQGTGLGLSTVRDIARNHGGFVEVWSEANKGSRFSVYFPAPEAQTPEARHAEAPPVPLGHGELVLVADDEQSILKLAKNILEAHGYRVLAANDGREALEVFSRHRSAIRAVVIDLMMPTLDGKAAIRVLRTHDPQLPILAVSGTVVRDGEASHPNGNGTDQVAFLPKPFTVHLLLTALHDALTGKHAPVQLST